MRIRVSITERGSRLGSGLRAESSLALDSFRQLCLSLHDHLRLGPSRAATKPLFLRLSSVASLSLTFYQHLASATPVDLTIEFEPKCSNIIPSLPNRIHTSYSVPKPNRDDHNPNPTLTRTPTPLPCVYSSGIFSQGGCGRGSD